MEEVFVVLLSKKGAEMVLAARLNRNEDNRTLTTLSKQRAPGPQLPAIVPAGETCTVSSDSAVITLKPGMTCHSALSVEFAHPGSVASLPRMPKSLVLPKYCFSALPCKPN